MDDTDVKRQITGPGEEASIAEGEFADPSGEIERRLVRKLDLNIVPIVMAAYMFSFLGGESTIATWLAFDC